MKNIFVIEVLYIMLAFVLFEAFMLAVWAHNFTWVIINVVLLGALALRISNHIDNRINK